MGANPNSRLGIGAATVQRYFLRRLHRRARQDHPLACPQVLGIDEHFFTRKKITPPRSATSKRIYDLTRGRSEAALESYILRLEGKEQVRVVSMDLAAERFGGGMNLEAELRNALARGRGWLVNEAGLRLIESLCITSRCVRETQQGFRAAKAPVRVWLTEQPTGDLGGSVGQYYGFDSPAALENKMAQYPSGTQFAYDGGRLYSKALEELRRFAAGKGLRIAQN